MVLDATMQLNRRLAALRESTGGMLPAYAFPGAYPMVYVTADGLMVCPRCANDAETSDAVVDGDVLWEGPAMTCDDCGAVVASAYGEG